MDIGKSLEFLGLAGNESKVYLALLELGSAKAGIITKKSGVNRTNVYDALARLIEKGLVSYVIQSNRKYFEAKTPDNILHYLDDQEETIRKKKGELKNIISALNERRSLTKQTQESTIYQGRKGLRSLAEDVLKAKQEIKVYGAEGKFVDIFDHYAENWHLRRGKSKIPLKILYNERIRESKKKSHFLYCEMRFNKNVQETPATTWIYGDKVAIIVWSDQPVATLIRSREVAKSYSQFFDFLWSESSK